MVEFTAGQFLMLELPSGVKRAYSIASEPRQDNQLQLLVGNVIIGEGTKYLCSLQEGDAVQFLCPFGLLGFLAQEQEETIFVATSTGLAPFRAMLIDQLSKGYSGKMHLIYGNRFAENMLYEEELRSWANQHSNFTYQNTLSRPPDNWHGKSGYVVERLKEMNLKDGKKRLFYLCGGQAMIEDVRNYLLTQDIERKQIRFESFG